MTFGGLQVGGKYQFGNFNGQWSLLPKGLQQGKAWLVGASYSVGPIIFGASYYNYLSAGDLGNAYFGRQRVEQGFAAGGTYSLAPGVSLFLSYLYGQRKQNGFNFVTGQGVSGRGAAGQCVQQQDHVQPDLAGHRLQLVSYST